MVLQFQGRILTYIQYRENVKNYTSDKINENLRKCAETAKVAKIAFELSSHI